MTNTIKLSFKVPKDNPDTIYWYYDIHIHNKTKYEATHEVKKETVFMEWKKVKEEDCEAVINAITELSLLYNLNITTSIEEEK